MNLGHLGSEVSMLTTVPCCPNFLIFFIELPRHQLLLEMFDHPPIFYCTLYMLAVDKLEIILREIRELRPVFQSPDKT